MKDSQFTWPDAIVMSVSILCITAVVLALVLR